MGRPGDEANPTPQDCLEHICIRLLARQSMVDASEHATCLCLWQAAAQSIITRSWTEEIPSTIRKARPRDDGRPMPPTLHPGAKHLGVL